MEALMLRIALILVFMAGPAAATPEYVLPTFFDVIGVDADDVLNIRARPSAKSEIIGTLAPDATQIEVLEETYIANTPWYRVNTGESSGWISGHYATPRYDVWEYGELPASFQCFGTEPFWNLRQDAGDIVLTRPDHQPERQTIRSVLGTGMFRDPMRAILTEGMTVTATVQACSDGMSDRHFGLEAHVILHDAEPQMLSGCCSIQP